MVVMLFRLRGGGYYLSRLGEVAGLVAPQIIFSIAKFNIDGKTAYKDYTYVFPFIYPSSLFSSLFTAVRISLAFYNLSSEVF